MNFAFLTLLSLSYAPIPAVVAGVAVWGAHQAAKTAVTGAAMKLGTTQWSRHFYFNGSCALIKELVGLPSETVWEIDGVKPSFIIMNDNNQCLTPKEVDELLTKVDKESFDKHGNEEQSLASLLLFNALPDGFDIVAFREDLGDSAPATNVGSYCVGVAKEKGKFYVHYGEDVHTNAFLNYPKHPLPLALVKEIVFGAGLESQFISKTMKEIKVGDSEVHAEEHYEDQTLQPMEESAESSGQSSSWMRKFSLWQ